jgi:hypothetical protein
VRGVRREPHRDSGRAATARAERRVPPRGRRLSRESRPPRHCGTAMLRGGGAARRAFATRQPAPIPTSGAARAGAIGRSGRRIRPGAHPVRVHRVRASRPRRPQVLWVSGPRTSARPAVSPSSSPSSMCCGTRLSIERQATSEPARGWGVEEYKLMIMSRECALTTSVNQLFGDFYLRSNARNCVGSRVQLLSLRVSWVLSSSRCRIRRLLILVSTPV